MIDRLLIEFPLETIGKLKGEGGSARHRYDARESFIASWWRCAGDEDVIEVNAGIKGSGNRSGSRRGGLGGGPTNPAGAARLRRWRGREVKAFSARRQGPIKNDA